MKRLAAVMAIVIFGLGLAAPAMAADEGRVKSVSCVVSPEGGGGCVAICDDDDDCQVFRLNEDGKRKVIKLKGLKSLGADIDAKTHGQLIDQEIRYIKETAPLRTDLAVKKLELRKLRLAEKPDDAAILAKRKEINAVKARLEDKKLEYDSALDKLMPEGTRGLMFLDDLDLPGLESGLLHGLPRRIIRRIEKDAD